MEYKTSIIADCLSNSPALAADEKEAKNRHYGFLKDTFRELKSGVKSWSEISEFGSPVACPDISFLGMTGEEVARVELYSRARSFDSASLRSG